MSVKRKLPALTAFFQKLTGIYNEVSTLPSRCKMGEVKLCEFENPFQFSV